MAQQTNDNYYDKKYRDMFTHPQMVKELMLDFVKDEWVAGIDFTTLEKVATNFVNKEEKDRRTDIIFKVRYNGEDLYIYLLLEFQSSVDKFMGLRVLSYIILFYEDLIKQNKVQDQLPFVFPLVLYNGDQRWTAATEFSKLIRAPHTDMKQYVPELIYELLAINAMDPVVLQELKGAVSTLFVAEQSDESNIQENLDRISHGIVEILDADLRKALYNFIVGILARRDVPAEELENISETEVKSMLRTTVDRMWEKSKQEGKLEGRLEGKLEGKHEEKIEIVKNMLDEGYKIEAIAKVTNLTIEEVKKIDEGQ